MSVPLVWPKNVMSNLLTKAHLEKHRRGKKARGRRKTARDRRKRAGGAEVTVASPDGSFFESVVYCFDPVHHSLFSWKKQPLKFHSKLLRWKKRLTQKRPTKHTMIQIQLLGLLPQVGMEFSTSDEAWAFWLRRLLFLLRWCGHLGVAGYLPRGGAALGVAVAGILDGGGGSSEPYHFVIVDDDGNE
nr:uncharacterized protein LOC117837643 isoform X3 [Setaria viridis]